MTQNEGSQTSEKLTFLLLGAGIGATLALLFAPKPGRELRNDIADYTKRGIDAANEGARVIGDRATDIYDTGRGKLSEAVGTARERIGQGAESVREKIGQSAESVSEIAARQKEQIAAAIEAGKQAYREEKRKAGETGGGAAVQTEEA